MLEGSTCRAASVPKERKGKNTIILQTKKWSGVPVRPPPLKNIDKRLEMEYILTIWLNQKIKPYG
jgi:hypothetical protein